MKKTNLRSVGKKVAYLTLNFILLFGLLRLIIKLAETQLSPTLYYVGVTAYFTGAAVLALLYFIWNGCTFQSRMPTPDDLPADWSPERRQTYLVKLTRTKARAQKLLYVLFPLVLVLAFSYIELWIF